MITIDWPWNRAPMLTCSLCGKTFRYRGSRDSSAVDGSPVWCDECEKKAKLREPSIEICEEKSVEEHPVDEHPLDEESAKKRLLDIARAELGYREIAGNRTKYASAYDYDTRLYGFDMDGSPWCDYFVDWCFMRAFGFDVGSAMTYQYRGCSGAACSASASYYRSAGAFFDKPEIGNQIFFYVSGDINHTGIVEEICNGYVTTIEGNSSDSVRRNQYKISDPCIAGYGRPNWKAAQNAKAPSEELDPIVEPVCPNLDADGEFGRLTEQALTEFQRKNGLEADGICGTQTWAKLFDIIKTKQLRSGDCGWFVTALQAALNAIGED